MKRIRGVVAALALSAVLVAPRQAEAQVQLGWNSSLALLCLNVGCTNVQFTLSLSGLKPFDNNGNPVPLVPPFTTSPGYLGTLTIDIFSGPGVFSAASVLTGGSATWFVDITSSGGLQIFAAHPTASGVASPITINATLSVGVGAYAFGYSGVAYLGSTGACFGPTGATKTCVDDLSTYRQGDFNGVLNTSTIPEPMSMTLLGTGLLGLGLVGIKRRKNAKK